MRLAELATAVRAIREDAGTREAFEKGDTRLLEGFSAEEKLALQSLAKRVQAGDGLPKHLKRSPKMLVWTAEPSTKD